MKTNQVVNTGESLQVGNVHVACESARERVLLLLSCRGCVWVPLCLISPPAGKQLAERLLGQASRC